FLGDLTRATQPLLRSLVLGDRGPEQEKRRERYGNESLQCEQTLMQHGSSEGTVTRDRSPDGDRRRYERRRYGAALSEAQGGEDERRKHEICLLERRRGCGAAKDVRVEAEQSQRHHRSLTGAARCQR